jgi:hypothetical protein
MRSCITGLTRNLSRGYFKVNYNGILRMHNTASRGRTGVLLQLVDVDVVDDRTSPLTMYTSTAMLVYLAILYVLSS